MLHHIHLVAWRKQPRNEFLQWNQGKLEVAVTRYLAPCILAVSPPPSLYKVLVYLKGCSKYLENEKC